VGEHFNGEDRALLHDIDKRVGVIQNELTNINGRLRYNVSKEAFKPVASIAYGLAGSVLTGVVGALLWLVLRK
jgi:hypothetical protein